MGPVLGRLGQCWNRMLGSEWPATETTVRRLMEHRAINWLRMVLLKVCQHRQDQELGLATNQGVGLLEGAVYLCVPPRSCCWT